ncbi:hypothetical protein D0C36_12925 [Mucilaginibacter conchicola]|uniref:DUF5050 domain-containing protein n=1 Tax=Mucilaginibacter conchicola TaxID=2303333 RepID=A0A372NTU3_9SPHI|nr:PD40 domain-containing protein [Mucilaginibacter conchicola]RFZ92331.1 hypothetical protein D0C36_12925 [Mucilaginibacter conchicola]
MKRIALLTLVFLAGMLISCQKDSKIKTVVDTAQSTKTSRLSTNAVQAKPAVTGKLVYHSYSCYACAGTKMYIYNFSTNTLTWVSQNWNIDYPMNAHFSPDGTKIVFMGQPAGSGDWDIYLWTVGSSSAPTNLTAGNNLRDEDPKFSPNGYRIAFKQAGDLKIMELTGSVTNVVTNTPSIEEGMPYYNDDATGLLYARGAGSASDIYKINLDGTNNTALANVSGVQEYYPIKRDQNTFLYSRWYSSTDHHDQVYMGYFANSTRTRLPFNNNNAEYADAYPCGTDNVILSSTRSGTVGGYDLYIANINTGAIYSLSTYNSGINSSVDELGSAYTPN